MQHTVAYAKETTLSTLS